MADPFRRILTQNQLQVMAQEDANDAYTERSEVSAQLASARALMLIAAVLQDIRDILKSVVTVEEEREEDATHPEA